MLIVKKIIFKPHLFWLLLKQKDPERFKYKYGSEANESSLVKQT